MQRNISINNCRSGGASENGTAISRTLLSAECQADQNSGPSLPSALEFIAIPSNPPILSISPLCETKGRRTTFHVSKRSMLLRATFIVSSSHSRNNHFWRNNRKSLSSRFAINVMHATAKGEFEAKCQRNVCQTPHCGECLCGEIIGALPESTLWKACPLAFGQTT